MKGEEPETGQSPGDARAQEGGAKRRGEETNSDGTIKPCLLSISLCVKMLMKRSEVSIQALPLSLVHLIR